MSHECSEIERIVRSETVIIEHGKKLDGMDTKLDILIEKVGAVANNRGFIGGIAAVGWLFGALMCDLVKPFAKPVLAAILSMLR